MMQNIIWNKQFQEFNLLKKSIGLVLLIFLIFTFFTFTAEARRNLGKLVKSEEVKSQFKTGNTPKGYSYYFRGSSVEPEAVIGISQDYVLQSKLWKPFNPEALSIQTLMQKMYYRNSHRGSYFGAWLKDQKDEIMGIYYSDTKDVKIKMAGDNQIDYITPIVRSHHKGNTGGNR